VTDIHFIRSRSVSSEIELQTFKSIPTKTSDLVFDTTKFKYRQHRCRYLHRDRRNLIDSRELVVASLKTSARSKSTLHSISSTESLSLQSHLSQPLLLPSYKSSSFPSVSLLYLQHTTRFGLRRTSTPFLPLYLTTPSHTLLTMSPSTRRLCPQGRVTKQKALPKSSPAFEILPVEVHLSDTPSLKTFPHTDGPLQIRQSIAGYLDDNSVASYRLIYTSTKHALDEDEGSFWRSRYLDTFDPPQNTPTGERSVVNEWFKKQYQCRKRVEYQRFDFQVGNSRKEMECLSLMKDLINGTWATFSLCSRWSH
jgi:hypothetical protein